MEEKVIKVFEYARKRGIPIYEYSYEEKIKEFNKIIKSNFQNGIMDDNVIKQYLHGIGLTWSYFPHHWSIHCGRMKTPLDIFNNDELLKKALTSRIKRGGEKIIKDGGFITDSNLRKAIRTASGGSVG